jgi:histidinol dehydrogenase
MKLSIVPAAEVETRLARVLARSAASSPDVDAAVAQILADVRARGDAALADLTERFDGVRPDALRVPPQALERALGELDADLRAVIEAAAGNVRRFHARQVEQSWFADEPDGVILGQRIAPMERAGLYVPGGTAFYPSSLIMNAVPAQVAGVREIALVSPPQPDGLPHPTVLATAALLGLDEVYAVGGAQAVGALAFGTETVGRVDVIVGPGNVYVATAKKQVYGQVAIDSVAGPSEIVVIADDTADATHVAADLLSQAEHDARASAILLTPSRDLAERVQSEVERLCGLIGRSDQIDAALRDFSAAVVTGTLDEAIALSNRLAPEHLEVLTADPWSVLPKIRHAGAIFLGDASSEPVGDYFAGPNHVLPTGGTARFASALGVHDFVRRQSVIAYSAERLARTGPQIVRFAQAEGLDAHALAIRSRLERV